MFGGSCAGRSAGGSATGSRGRRRSPAVGGEERVEVAVRTARAGARSGGCRRHQVHHVDHADFQVRAGAAAQVHGGQGLERGDIAAAGRRRGVSSPWSLLATPVPGSRSRACSGGWPGPSRASFSEGLLARDDHVHVLAGCAGNGPLPTTGSWRPAAGRRGRPRPSC